MEKYSIDDCMIDVIDARNMWLFILSILQQKDSTSDIVFSSNALSGMELMLKESIAKLDKSISYMDTINGV